jgi:hypothetical protein
MSAARRAGDPGAAENAIDAHDIDTVVFALGDPFDAPLLDYFRSRYEDRRHASGIVAIRVRP